MNQDKKTLINYKIQETENRKNCNVTNNLCVYSNLLSEKMSRFVFAVVANY